MGKGRMEAFSDGVLAIIITIMVLDLKVPQGAGLQELAAVGPIALSYLLSYVYLGIYWNNHHHLLQGLREVSASILWANLHLLFWLSLLPWATAWMSVSHFAAVPTLAYGCILLMAALAYLLLQTLVVRRSGENSALRQALGRDAKGKLSLLSYSLAIVVAGRLPHLAETLYVLVALLWLIPDRRLERAMPH